MTNLPKFSPKEIHYFNRIDKYFRSCTPDAIKNMLNIIDGESPISLRILDWFVTRYTKNIRVSLNINGDNVDVHVDYKAHLKSYKKKYFDPFRRSFKTRPKFDYKFKKTGQTICTTIGQLNFFSWAISSNIIKYVDTNYDNIIKEMNLSNKNDKKKKKEKQLGKIKMQNNLGNNVNIGVSKQITNEQCKIVVTFD